MKLIIDISEEAYNVLLTEQVLPSHIDVEWLLIHGIPLDDIKTKIANIYCGQYCENPLTADAVREMILDILDNIGKAESEEV